MNGPTSERLRAIIRTQNEIAATDLDLDAVMQLIASRAEELTGAIAGLVEIADGDKIAHRVTTGEATSSLGLKPKMASSLSVPLVHGGETVGVLEVYAPETDYFDDGDIEALELLSQLIAARMSHASLFAAEAHDSRHDALTGLLNLRAYEERLAVEASRAVRHEQPLSLCLLDLNGFKAVNDTLGHPEGDQILRRVAALIDESRLADDAFRIGGDEFAILMPQTTREDAERAAARLAMSIVDASLGEGTVGVSIGVAESVSGDPVALHAAADKRLLAAKDQLYGRGL